LVRDRAAGVCEYCLIDERDSFFPHQPDHVIAAKHGGRTVEDNLAWSCFRCNGHKGSDIASVDPKTGKIVRLFNPRDDRWPDHFRHLGGLISGRTAEGRVTVRLLRMNSRKALDARRALIAEGRWPSA
jgi:hypothetical protein